MTDIVIAGALRTAIGKFGGTLAKTPAPELGATVIRALLERSGVKPDADFRSDPRPGADRGQRPEPGAPGVDSSGLPHAVPAMTINMVCGSGLKAVMLAAQAIRCGDADIVDRRRAGEHERVAARAAGLARRLPHGRREARRHDDRRRPVGRLQPVPHGHRPPRTSRKKYEISRAEQDEFAVASQNKAEAAQKAGRVQGRDRAGDDPAAQRRSRGVRAPTNSSRQARRSIRSRACGPRSRRTAA